MSTFSPMMETHNCSLRELNKQLISLTLSLKPEKKVITVIQTCSMIFLPSLNLIVLSGLIQIFHLWRQNWQSIEFISFRFNIGGMAQS